MVATQGRRPLALARAPAIHTPHPARDEREAEFLRRAEGKRPGRLALLHEIFVPRRPRADASRAAYDRG